ncbi:MAG: formylmethanofuran--tetrahydromethanopterin N-formyltransferase [Candidatus Bathyarchaeota archaeon]|nr:formylmethanofuran--tetrahydromethanopterin N-formyltransferase [Candidatus Bathyarchaeota archaeon]
MTTLTENNKLEILSYDDKEQVFAVKSPAGNTVKIQDTFAEMFPLWAGRILITAENEKWAQIAASVTTGFATSVIMAPAEAAVERPVPAAETPDNRPGVLVQIYNRDRFELKHQLMERIGQCIMTCPTTAAFNGLTTSKRVLKVGSSLRYFGDGFQKKAMVGGRRCWKIPVMEGNFIVEDGFGAQEAVAGGNFMIFAENQTVGLKAAEAAADAIRANAPNVIMPFPGGICRAGSKAGSLKYKMKASTNHPYCPTLRTVVPDSVVPENVQCVYEIVMNGLTLDAVKNAMKQGVIAAASTPGVVKISSGNYGGKLGPFKAFLKEVIEAP